MKARHALLTFSCAAACLFASTAIAADYTVVLKNKKFSTSKLTIKVGDTVYFKDEDPATHSIFSLSDVAVFDLGSYPTGQSRAQKFTKSGRVEVECAVHSNMHMEIEVRP